jgi:amidase
MELWRRSARELAHLIASRQVSSREVVTAHLQRIEEVNPHLNAVVRRMDESALAGADAADAAVRRGDRLGPLHGVPFSVKENIDVAGTPTTSAVVALAEAYSNTDAPVVERMKAAGGIVIGRTNLPDMGLRIHTDSSLHGLTRNPWNPDRTAGGSSGGEGSALASGMSPIGLGNDIGGSLRNPAHCCGVASIKPTQGVIPSATEIPPTGLSMAFQLMASEGVMARRVADVRLGFDIVRGQHWRDPYSVTASLAEATGDRPWRVAVMDTPPGGSTDPGIAAAVRAAGEALARAGHHVETAAPPDFEEVVSMWASTINADLLVSRPLLEAVMGEDAKTFLGYGMSVFPALDAEGLALLHLRRFEVAAKWAQWFGDYDVMLSPTWALPAFEHGFDVAGLEQAMVVLETFRTVLPMNLFGSPSAVVPAAISQGMPVGVQVSAWRFDDLKCLTAAQVIDEMIGITTPIDPCH